MTDVLQIHEPAPLHANRPRLDAFLSLGFRPLYIAGCAWALLSIAVWIFFPQFIGYPLSAVAWHAHEMLWGFIATIAVAFLLTASATWTGINPLKGRALGFICLLWVIARLGYLFGGEPGFWLAAICETGFFALGAAALMRVMHKAGNRRNYGVPWLILGLGSANVLFLQAALKGDHGLLIQRFDMGLICMAVIALLIGRRVIPFFAMRMVPGLQIPMQVRSGQAQIVIGLMAILIGLIGPAANMAPALAIVGLISLIQIIIWKPLAVRHKPLLWILYFGYAGLGAGLVFAAAQLAGITAGVLARPAAYIHIIGMGGFSVLIIGMVTRTALGHLGRPLKLDRSMLLSYFLMLAAVALRLAALWPGAASLWLLQAAALSWIAAFALYLWRFTPMLIRPRADANPAPNNR